MNRWFSVLALLVLTTGSGCITSAGGGLPPIEPRRPGAPPAIEQTVGDFAFTLEGGKMITSNKAGRGLNDAILGHWKKTGYISGFTYVPSGEFSGRAAYNLTLSGSQYGESSIILQVLSGLTLLLIPHYVDTRYDIQYTLENVKTGQKYMAAVDDSYETWSQLLLIFALPFADAGARKTWNGMADHLYEQLRAQGAFDS